MDEDIAEIKAASKMNELKIQALINLLAKEGIISRDDFKKELGALCEGEKE
jgi:hypothetical protein